LSDLISGDGVTTGNVVQETGSAPTPRFRRVATGRQRLDPEQGRANTVGSRRAGISSPKPNDGVGITGTGTTGNGGRRHIGRSTGTQAFQ
jgi:hypothetical protein